MINSEEIYRMIVKDGEDWADKDAAANLFEETTKTVLAELMNGRYENSQAAKESAARVDEKFKTHIESMVEARRLANRAKVKYDGARLLCDLRRTEESTKRAAMRGA